MADNHKGSAVTGSDKRDTVLEVKDLRVHYATPEGDVIAANGVSFNIYKGELLGLVGESGCGKTTAAMAILRLVQPPGRILNGQAILNGTTDLLSLSKQELRRVRWQEISLIPQGAMNSLNPVMRIKNQIADGIETHEGKQPKKALKERILKLNTLVGLPTRVYTMYPHELSGGMKQRVCIAMAIALNPSLVIADEPTSALDVIVQRVVAQTLLDIKDRLGVSMLVIGHDMGLMAQVVDRVAVMYAGNIVEVGPVRAALKEPLHPYSQLLIESIPSIKERKPLKITEGLTHDLRNPPPGCIFQLRCSHVTEKCRVEVPPLQKVGPGHKVACRLYE
jgi:oligopeptide/dipeptide ABC transporter ATP-binding protein